MYITPTWWKLWFDGILLINETGNLNLSSYLDANSTREYNIYYGPTTYPVSGSIGYLYIRTFATWDDLDVIPTPDPTANPTLTPTSLPTSFPTSDPTMDTSHCDYSMEGPVEIQSEGVVRNVTVYENTEISFQLKTAPNWTCGTSFCSFLRLGAESGDPKLPQLFLRNTTKLKMSIHNNTKKAQYTINKDEFKLTHNDGEYHSYQVLMTPTMRVLWYDDVAYINKKGDFNASDYIDANGTQWKLQIPGKENNFVNGTIKNLCIINSATTQPTSDPTLEPTLDPTSNPTMQSPTFSPTATPISYPSFSPTTVPTKAPVSYPTISPITVPTNGPTIDPTVEPTSETSLNPTINPTTDPIIDTTDEPTEEPTVVTSEDPTLNPTVYPTQDRTFDPTLDPTLDPIFDSDPSSAPTINPTMNPTRNPTIEPTQNPTGSQTTDSAVGPSSDPTINPTSAPIPVDVFCGDSQERKYNGNWEYYLHIYNDSVVTFDTCSLYLNPFSLRIDTINTTNTTNITLYAECPYCGSICHEPSMFSVDMAANTYLLTVEEKHAVEIKCAPAPHPTKEPTASLTSAKPTLSPSARPSRSPTTANPTPQEIVVNVTFGDDGSPTLSSSNLSDPFGRFEAIITVIVHDETGVLGNQLASCHTCFVWQYEAKGQNAWSQFEIDSNDDISMTITRSENEYVSKLVLQSIRRSNAGHCVDDELKDQHPFEEGTDYRLRLKFESDADVYFVSEISKDAKFSTNELSSGGVCIIQNVDNLLPLDPYNLFCTGWSNEENLKYNALIDDVAMNTAGYVDDARQITGIAPVGNVSITVLVKEQEEYNAITCYEITETFKSIEEVLNDVPDNETSTEVVDSILETINNITATDSLSDKPDYAVSIHSVVEDLYETNLTTQNEAEQIVDDMVINILETSTVVSSSNVSTTNITGDAIITELAAVSSITSNEDIVDAESTTTQLVEEYLPDIFEAVDIYIDSSENNKTANTSSSEVQDALYSIGAQSQGLISNLEATLVDAVNTINSSNLTDEDIDSVNSLSESLVDFATLAASTALAQSEIGETFNYEDIVYDDNGTIINSKVVTATKFEADPSSSERPSCGSSSQRIEMPETFMSDQEGTFDCAFVASTRNNFVPKGSRNEGRRQTSNGIVTANVYGEGSRRRRLAETVDYETDECFPYLIVIAVTNTSIDPNMVLDESSDFPSCDFWNTNASYWDTEGCFVYDITNDSVICGCTHLTTFSASADEIWPEPNTLTDIDWKNLTISNLIKYPTVWITCLSLFIVIMIICLLNPRSADIHTKSAIAFEDIILKSTQELKLWEDVSGKEIEYYSEFTANQNLLGLGLKKQMQTKEDRKSMAKLFFKLFRLYLRNDHTVLSVFQRTSGTNWSLRQRLGCFFVYICTIMVATGMYYEVDSTNIWSDMIMSFMTSIIATTPGFIIRKMFEYSKPKEDRVKSVPELIGIDSGSEGGPSSRSMEENKNLKIVKDMRLKFYEWMFPLPSYCRDVAWVILILWAGAACVTAVRTLCSIISFLQSVTKDILACSVPQIVYGLSFDVPAESSDNEDNKHYTLYQNGCWNTSLQLRIENELSLEAFLEDYEEQEENNSSGYGGSDTGSWLLSLFQSLMLSIFIWQPLVMMIWTLLCVWMYVLD